MPNYNINLITSKRSYSINEVASLLSIDRRTCGRWIKYEGLRVIEENTNPILIMGEDLRSFIKERKEKRKIPLKDNEFLCMKCRKAVRALSGSEETVKTGKKIGKDDQEQLKKIGICENCNTQLNKFLGVYQWD